MFAWCRNFTETAGSCVEPLFPGPCWRLVNCRYGNRGVGEASHPGPFSFRRLRSGRSEGVWADISSDEEPDRGADECSSASSGEREDIGDEEVEWGALPRLPSGQAEEGRGQVGQRRVVLVPEESQGTSQSVQDREPTSTVPVTTFPAI